MVLLLKFRDTRRCGHCCTAQTFGGAIRRRHSWKNRTSSSSVVCDMFIYTLDAMQLTDNKLFFISIVVEVVALLLPAPAPALLPVFLVSFSWMNSLCYPSSYFPSFPSLVVPYRPTMRLLQQLRLFNVHALLMKQASIAVCCFVDVAS